MFKRLNAILFALCVFFGTLHNAWAESPIKRTGDTSSIATSLERLAVAYEKQADAQRGSNREAEPCSPGDDRRYSDLCAQWKAADAAADSAWWAWASALGVGAALSLTIWTNSIMRDTARRQLRAYLVTAGIGIEWRTLASTGERHLSLRAQLINSGQTPAHSAKFIVGYSLGKMPDFLSNELNESDNSQTVVGANLNIDTPDIWLDESLVIQAFKEPVPLYFYGTVSYRDIFNRKYITQFLWQITFSKTRDAEVPDAVRWHCVGDHNNAT